ncbi:MAG: hypothetical protein GY751_01970 [Bacteroidetes bacterium]|nr:hypothetical protein [Bacteroidota bacterium]
MTIEAGLLTPIVTEFDFTNTSFIAHGSYPMREYNNEYAMWCGDLNHDGKVLYQGPENDITTLWLAVMSDPGNIDNEGDPQPNYIKTGYETTDIDLDGVIIYQGPNNDRDDVLFRTIAPHPGNENLLANFIVIAQLP